MLMCQLLTIHKKTIRWLFYSFLMLCAPWVYAQEINQSPLDQIINYTEYDSFYSSSGQVTARDLENLEKAGFERIIYIAFNDPKKALLNEDKLVMRLGMKYFHIPVEWNNPELTDFMAFASIMQMEAKKRTLLHCQVNYRASVFSFLYRVIYNEEDIAIAKLDMERIWKPNRIWKDFIFNVLEYYQLSPDCDKCDWS